MLWQCAVNNNGEGGEGGSGRKNSPFGLTVITINMHVVQHAPNLITEMNGRSKFSGTLGQIYQGNSYERTVLVKASSLSLLLEDSSGKYLKCKHEWIISFHWYHCTAPFLQ